MEFNIPQKITLIKKKKVEGKDLASSFGSGTVDVFATPAMIAFMEAASLECIAPYIPEEFTSVGSYICVKHLKPTPLDMEVHCKTEVLNVKGRKIVFKVEVLDENGLAGEGEHHRYIVEKSGFSF